MIGVDGVRDSDLGKYTRCSKGPESAEYAERQCSDSEPSVGDAEGLDEAEKKEGDEIKEKNRKVDGLSDL